MTWEDLFTFKDPTEICIASTTASTTDCFSFNPESGLTLSMINNLNTWIIFIGALLLLSIWVSIVMNFFKR